MHRHLLTACALIALTLSGCEGGGNEADANAAAAGGGDGEIAGDFTEAADALQAKLAAPGQNGELVPAGDPAVQAFDRQADRALAALGTPQLPVQGFETFEAFCAKTAGIVGAYLTAGTSSESGPTQQQMLANSARYLDQMFTPLLFAAHCSAQHMPFLEETVSKDDVSGKEAALQQVRDGAFSQAAGLMEMAAADDLEPARRARVVDLLAQDAEEFAIALSPQQRQQLAQMAQQLGSRLPPESAGKAETIRAAFQNRECGALCSM